MAKVSPIARSFNAGEFSRLLDGRVDLERYSASMRALLNFVAAPQGPAIARSGTGFTTPAYSDTSASRLLPFVFSSTQALQMEVTSGRVRFINEDGLQVYTPVTAVVTSPAGAFVKINSAPLAALVGDQVALSGFPDAYGLNGRIANVTAKAGNVHTLDVLYPAGVPVVNGIAARVYHVACDYAEDELAALLPLQSVDVVYVLSDKRRPKKFSRYGNYDWRIEPVKFKDGPYAPENTTPTTLTPTATGNLAAVVAPADAAASGSRPLISGTRATPVDFLERQITYNLAATPPERAFSESDEYWASNTQQSGWVSVAFATPKVCDGYTIYAATDNQDTTYAFKDYAPSSFTFEGWDGAAWVELDRQQDYVLYDGNKSVFIEINNTVAYIKYRLNITKLVRNGLIEARVRRLTLREKSNASFDLVASSVTGINNDTGFKTTDVGRLIRIQGSDQSWRACSIEAWVSATRVTVKLLGEPLTDLKAIKGWRLGYWSDTTGWPSAGTFFDDRLWLAGSIEAPDMFAGSVSGAYENFSQTDAQGVVLDDNAVVGRLNSRKLSKIEWLASDSRGMLLGTGSEEYVLSAPSNESLNARNAKARPATRRGSAPVEPVLIDNQILFVQRGGRAIREFAFVFESDGYKSPSMSQLASHLGAIPFADMAFAQEPHGIVWVRRLDGSVVGLTYNREENVIGWHRHDFSGAYVESISVIPQRDGLQDALWMVTRRTIGGQTKRYIECLTRFWDFDTELDDAHFVDCGSRYVGTPTKTIYGLWFLEGEEVYGLADAKPVGPLTVENGSVTLAFEASNVVLGMGFDARGELQRFENGAADGTAQGKTKRINNITVNLWRSYGGSVGVYNQQQEDFVYEPITYPGDFDRVQDVELFTGMIGPFTPSPGYDQDGILSFLRAKDSPLPFNIIAVMPQMNTQDR